MEKCFFDVLVFIYQHYQLSIYVKCSRYSGCLLQQPCCICCCIRIDHYSSAGMERLFGYWSQLAKTQKQLMLLLCNALCKYDARCWSLTFTMCLQINVPNLAVQNIQRSLRRGKKKKLHSKNQHGLQNRQIYFTLLSSQYDTRYNRPQNGEVL